MSAINKVSVFRDGLFTTLKGRAGVNIRVVDWNYYKYIIRASI